jgi:hypothetical protein
MQRLLAGVVSLLATAVTSDDSEVDPCQARSGNPERVPCLKVPRCPAAGTVDAGFYINTVPGLVPALQATSLEVCWNSSGLSVKTNATDVNIFNTATRCQQGVFNTGDTLEVFLGPVLDATDDPVYYHEIDTGSSGAMWVGQAQHGMGRPDGANVSNCGVATPPPCESNNVAANCTGLAGYLGGALTSHVTIGDGWWANDLVIPWSTFKQPFLDHTASPPWKIWRANFYRYDYPFPKPDGDGYNSSHELSAWSPTHSSTFHIPPRFGVVVLESD